MNPTTGLDLPAVRGERDRIAPPAEAEQLLAALADDDRALWATALYAGLRRGELMGLRWKDVDLPGGVLHVEQGWDPKAKKMVAPKSAAGRRTVPIPKALRIHLAALKMATEDSGVDPDRLVFGIKGKPFSGSAIEQRAKRAWKDAELEPIGLHDLRHTYASLMIAAGVNAKTLSTYMGHATTAITYDRYGHLFPGNEAQAAGLLDAYLDAEAAAR
jgi:integrase